MKEFGEDLTTSEGTVKTLTLFHFLLSFLLTAFILRHEFNGTRPVFIFGCIHNFLIYGSATLVSRG